MVWEVTKHLMLLQEDEFHSAYEDALGLCLTFHLSFEKHCEYLDAKWAEFVPKKLI